MSSLVLKPLSEQVLVITGASSGIGRATARMAAEAGARVVLAARDREALDDAAAECERAGGRAEPVRCDVAEPRDVERLARAAERAFGGVDTWVNDAGTTMYGTLEEVPLEDLRRLMDVNFWGVVHGSRAAVPLLERRGGGALVNVGSALSERAIPLQGMYCATKFAIRAFTDTLRMELEARGAPVSVSLVKPASVDTPIYDTPRNYMTRRPRPIPPVYAPEVAARVILDCATRPTRERYAGRAGAALGVAEAVAPRLTDRVMERLLFREQQRGGRPEPENAGPAGNLDAPRDHGAERGRRGRGAGARGAQDDRGVTRASRGRSAGPRAAAAFGVALLAGAVLGGRRGEG